MVVLMQEFADVLYVRQISGDTVDTGRLWVTSWQYMGG